jgi:hypothetical protein
MMKLLKKDSFWRFQTGRELSQALSGLSPVEPIAARPLRRALAPCVVVSVLAVVLAALVVYIKMDQGTLVLQINQPDVTVTIDGKRGTVRSPRDRINVVVGPHQLEVVKDGFKTFTQDFEVAHGGRVEIAAWLEPIPAGPPLTVPSAVTSPPQLSNSAGAARTMTQPPRPLPPIPAPKLVQSKLEVELSETFTQVRTGGGGRYLVFHLKNAGQLAIFDVAGARVVHTIDVGAEDVRFAAGLEMLLIVLPGQRLVHRYSLKTFHREKTAPLGLNDPVRIAVMGSNSDGPLALWARGDIVLWDVERMHPLPVKGKVLSGDPGHGFELRVSADGRALVGWTTGISGQHFSLMHWDGRTATLTATPDTFSFNGRWAQPTADASLILRFSGGMYTSDLQVIASSFEGAVLLPTEDRRFFLAVRPQSGLKERPGGRKKAASQATICTTADRRPIVTIENLEPVTTSMIPTFWGHVGGEPRVRYLPTAGVLLTLPETNDRVILRPLDLAQTLKRSGEDYLVVLSAPLTRAPTDSLYTYQLEVLSKAGGVRYALETGPKGMTVSGSGMVRWTIPPRQDGQVVHVVLAVRDASGKELFHAFDIQVK